MPMSPYQSLERQVAPLTGGGNGIRAAGAGAAVRVGHASPLQSAAAVVAGIKRVGGSASASQPDALREGRIEAACRKLPGRHGVRVELCGGPRNDG